MEELDWSALPRELLNLISKGIDNKIDLIRFRSVCSNWRRSSSVSNHHLNLTIKFPLLDFSYILSDSIDTTNTSFFSLSRRSIFLIKPRQHQQQLTLDRPWLLRITQNESGKIKPFLPLISYHSPLTSFYLPHLLDFNNLSVQHLGTEMSSHSTINHRFYPITCTLKRYFPLEKNH